MSEMSLVPGARISMISKANIRYEGTLVNVDDEEGKLALAHVQSFGTADKQTQSSKAAEHFVYGYVVFRRSELKEVKVLDTVNPWSTDSAIVKAVEACTESRAITFSNQVLTWIEKGENEKVNLILENSHLHQSSNAKEKTLLHYAVQYDNVTIVEKLLAMGSDVNAQDSMGMTPLMMAMAEKRKGKKVGWAVIKMILAAGADILILNKERKSAVHMYCADYEQCDIIGKKFFEKLKNKCPCSEDEVDILIDAGCSLHQAYEYLKDVRTIELMLQRGLPVDDLDELSRESVLLLAIECQDVECVELLLNYGASVHLEDDQGDTPWARLKNYDIVSEKEVRIVQLLLNHGASPTTCIPGGIFQGLTTLQGGEKDTIRELLQHNLDFTATDDYYKRYALHFLATNSNPGVVEELKCCREKINVNVRDETGATPLHFAAKWANVDMLAFLLSMGAEIDCHTTKGFTPLYYTCTVPYFVDLPEKDQCAELLLQHYADPQFVVAGVNSEQVTVFEAASTATNLNRTKSFVAQMAIQEGLGTPITEIIQGKIRSFPALVEHLNGCRRLLRQEISGSVTLLKLITSDKKKMAKLLNNQELVLKLEGNYFKELRSSSSFYRNTLKKRYSDGARYRRLKSKAVMSIAKIFQENVDEENLIVHRIIDFLDDESLECLEDLF